MNLIKKAEIIYNSAIILTLLIAQTHQTVSNKNRIELIDVFCTILLGR